MASREIPLTGGRTTEGVVRVGATVRRPPAANATFTRVLLEHLRSVGFVHAPRWEGTDAQGRTIYSYIEGRVPTELGVFTDPQVQRAARILRAFHDACAPLITGTGDRVVVHGDASPCNFVFVEDLPHALIDFDTAHIGPRARDVGYAAWLWLDLGNPELEAHAMAGRVAGFWSAYDPKRVLDDGPGLIAAILEAQGWLIARCDASRDHGPRSAATSTWAARCRQWVLANRETLTTD